MGNDRGHHVFHEFAPHILRAHLSPARGSGLVGAGVRGIHACRRNICAGVGIACRARTSRRILTITAGLHLHWLAGSTVGAVFASHMLGTIPGLDFILVGLFAVLAMDVLAQSRDTRTAGLAAACAAVGLVAAPHHMLLVAMTLFAVLLGIRYWL